MRQHFLRLTIFLFLIITMLLLAFPAVAAEKVWNGGGDDSTWVGDDNWSPAVAPAAADDVTIDTEGASVSCDRTFNAKSITLGGRETVTLTSENFVYGTVKPDTTSDAAILNRSGGTLTLKGVGVLTLKGQYKDSEESLTPEPSFIFWVE